MTKFLKIFFFLVIIGIAVYVILSPSTKILAQATCTVGGENAGIRIFNGGLLSASDTISFGYSTGTPAQDMKYICGNNALLPATKILSYSEMKSRYYNQAKRGIIKTSLTTGNQTTTTPTDPINLSSF